MADESNIERHTTPHYLEQHYAHFFEEAPIMMVISSYQDGLPHIDDCNAIFRSTLGYTRDELVGQPITKVYDAPSELALKMIENRHRWQDVLEVERTLVKKDGAPVETILRTRPIKDETGNVIGVNASYLDIRDRKRLENMLERERELLAERVYRRTTELETQTSELERVTRLQNAILTYGRTAILSISPEGLIRTINPAAVELFSISADAVKNNMCLAFDMERSTLTLQPYNLVTTSNTQSGGLPPPLGGQSAPREWTYVRPDGTLAPILLSIAPLLDEVGTPIGYVSMAQDISLQKESEEALRRSEEMLRTANTELARALRLKDEFVANMSHELRTPLNAILNLSESLAEEVAGPLNEKQQQYLQLILESGWHLLSLINDILDLSKMDAGRTSLDIVQIGVEPICQSSMRMVSEQANHKRLISSLVVDEDAQWVQADVRQLKQMLVNLLANAVKFTPKGGQYGLEVTTDRLQERISFSVWDTGIGIAAQEMGQLFQPFSQIDSGLSRQYGGSGLGLVLVSRMARLHGGGVRVESEAGKGSRFTIDLPWQPPELTVLREAPAAAYALETHGMSIPRRADDDNRPLILLVDDIELTVEPIVTYLEAHNYRVTIALGGQNAIAYVNEVQPDLILMDIQMPDIDGFEVVRRIREDERNLSIPIIALTALTLPGDRDRCLESGMNDYIAKPVLLRDLVEVIEKHLS